MIQINNPNQRTLFYLWKYLSLKLRTIMIEQLWPKLFRDKILCKFPVKEQNITKNQFTYDSFVFCSEKTGFKSPREFYREWLAEGGKNGA